MVLAGSVTTLQAPVAFAADPSATLVVSWARPGVATELVPPASLRMGDMVTVHVEMVGFDQPLCQTVFAGGGADHNYPSMWVVSESAAAGGCPDWTFVVPPSPVDDYRIATTAVEGAARASAVVPIAIEAGGEHVLFTSTYPVSSWSPLDLFGADQLTFGTPVTVTVPPSPPATACQLGFNGTFGNGFRFNAPDCSPWTVTIPELRPQFAASGPYAWPWEAGVMVSADDVESFGRRVTGTTFALNVTIEGDGGATSMASTAPVAIFQASNNPYFFERGTVPLIPTLVGVSVGSCEYQVKTPTGAAFVPVATIPIVDGQCPASVDAQEFGGYQYDLRVVGTDGHEISHAWAGFDVTAPIPPPTIELPPDPPAPGEDVPVDISVPTGAATAYSVAIASEPAVVGGSTGTASKANLVEVASPSGATCTGATGQLDVLKGDRDATAICRFAAAGTYRITASMTDAVGSAKTSSRLIVVSGDTAAPTTTKPTNAFASGARVSGGKPSLRFTWSGSDAASGVSHYQFALSTDNRPYTTLHSTLPSASLGLDLAPGHTYRARVRAIDNAGNVGAWTYGTSFRETAFQESSRSIQWAGTWRTGSSSNYWTGRDRYATRRAAKASLKFTGRSFAWVGSVGPTRGQARIYVNGVLVKSINLHATTSVSRRVLFATTWATAAARTITIRVTGTAHHPRADIDAFVVGS